MKNKTEKALKGLLESLRIHESETSYSAVEVDKEELRTLLRWAQNKAYKWYEGDRVKQTGTRVPYWWLTKDSVGTVYADSEDDGTVYVEWDNAPEDARRVKMYHNEIKLVKP